ncbi:unnamed protein product [Didymodactylos carnosus]|uniref:Uncharacterized protein n=1 Tax=Didymodactylos carnosus TaxID=1234261 RepID=A0A813WT64_9BILA|nr:unnamed protein product [Didymodactylos carnosus]CAF3647075.1 unnamed protein product [Didymodactylos carnosus]
MATNQNFDEIYNYAKKNENSDLIYKSLLLQSDVLNFIPKNETFSILHHIVNNANVDLFNKVIAIPNLRFILLTKTLTKPAKDILDISRENSTKSKQHDMMYKTIKRLTELDKFVDYAKCNQTEQCKQMLNLGDSNLVNMKPPYSNSTIFC